MKYIPGFALVIIISMLARFIQGQLTVNGKEVVSAVAIAIILGVLTRNLIGMPESCRPGANFAVKRLLRVGIALMGAQLSLGQVLKTGASSVLIVATCIVLAILVVRFVSIRMGMSDRLGTLLGVGTSICGVSAIVATAPAIEAKEEETSMAVATITIFGLLAVLFYPLLGMSLGLSDRFFGTWAGTAVNDTSQVVATGLIFSQQAGEIATVVKLTRNLFMAPVIVALSWFYLRRRQAEGEMKGEGRGIKLQQAVPLFVLGFVGMAVLNSLGAFPSSIRNGIHNVSQFLIVAALAGVGLETNVVAMRKIGLRPFYAGLCAAIFMAVVSFGLITVMGIR
ncbi:MAG: YeiH family protein [Deltaproteobacteria bacterium]|nr:YeiH family protein [Deltaproteobacteria bacterium]